MNLNFVDDIRSSFLKGYKHESFIKDKTGKKIIEIQNASFIADKPTIFGKTNDRYVEKEMEWYTSQSLNIYDMANPPKVWRDVCDKDGFINSNYGWCILSEENGSQFQNVVRELRKHPDSRRAVMIYTRPSMHRDYNVNGMSDFMCTNTVQYLIRTEYNDFNNPNTSQPHLHAIVNMRSNDAIYGYKNDYAWQQYVLEMLSYELGVPPGDIFWNAGSLHIYEDHFYLLHHYEMTNETTITKERYKDLYTD